jgi:hypothetical protein
MNGRFLILSRSIQEDLKKINEIYTALVRYRVAADADEGTLIVVSYYLHNLGLATEGARFGNRGYVQTFPRSNVPTFKRSHVPTFQRLNV